VLPDAQTVLDVMSAADQLAVMGPQRLELLRTGQVSWADLSMRRSTIGWRDSSAPRPVRDLAGLTLSGAG
jgi:hypothetical protein